MCASRFGIRPIEARKMLLWERAVLEAGLEWEAEQTPSTTPSEDDPRAKSSSGGAFLNLDEMAARGADVS